VQSDSDYLQGEQRTQNVGMSERPSRVGHKGQHIKGSSELRYAHTEQSEIEVVPCMTLVVTYVQLHPRMRESA
jgi:hypothetical protein